MTREELIEARNTLGLSQKGMAKAMGVHFETYRKWEWPEGSSSHRKISASTAAHVRLMLWVQENTPYRFYNSECLPAAPGQEDKVSREWVARFQAIAQEMKAKAKMRDRKRTQARERHQLKEEQ